MTRAELANRIAEATGKDPKTCLSVIEEFMKQVIKATASGEEVYLRGFGKFFAKERQKKPVQNFQTKETVISPKKRVPKFKAYSAYKKAVNDETAKASDGEQ